MIAPLAELYDYDVIRGEAHATMYEVHTDRPTLVLGSTQSIEVLNRDRLGDLALRRRRGGGGLVLLQPDDIWIDWWIPVDDGRWRGDVHASSRVAGQWWATALAQFVSGEISVHEGPLEGDPAYRLICFAGRGPGEVFVDGKKAAGVTQWRVREGVFVSTVLHAHASREVLTYLGEPPDGLELAIDHQVLSSLSDVAGDVLIESLRLVSGPWQSRVVTLNV